MNMRHIMKKLKIGISLIILGNLLCLAYFLFAGNETSDFGKFSSGLLVGMSKRRKCKRSC